MAGLDSVMYPQCAGSDEVETGVSLDWEGFRGRREGASRNSWDPSIQCMTPLLIHAASESGLRGCAVVWLVHRQK